MKSRPANEPAPVRLRLRISAAAETQVRSGHPWIYGTSVREQNRAGTLGELAVVYDRKDRFLAVGLFDPESPIRVRLLHVGKPTTLDEAWWRGHLLQALERRRGLFDEATTGYRWINGESDGWPGLVLDRYGGTLVLKLYTAAWLPRLEQLIKLIGRQLQPERLVLRMSRNIQETGNTRHSVKDGTVIAGASLMGRVSFQETGLHFEADVVRGQKTGFFLDQRENRRRVEQLASGRAVLNAFSFSGAFSLYAARGGARSVTDLDLSTHALASAERNFKLNQSEPALAACRHELLQAEAFEWLGTPSRRKFDLLILDPPSLAKRETERVRAIDAYRRLAALAMGHLAAGGILLACSCSAHVVAAEFFAAVRGAAAHSGRRFQELATTGHAADHPAAFPEALYLKAIYLQRAG